MPRARTRAELAAMRSERRRTPRRATRRTADVRVRGRAADVVERVLRATGELLGEVGYAALRVEDVAARSRVNKTTIYRRWPTRAELVAAALRHLKPAWDTARGATLREEVMAFAAELIAFHASPAGRGIVRVVQTELGHPELEPLVRDLRAEALQSRIALVERAIARGELPRHTDAALVADLLFAPLTTRLFHRDDPPDAAYVANILDIVIAGLRATACN